MKSESGKYYVNIGKASDLKNPRERKIYRAFEIIPGTLVWITLFGMVFFSWLRPVWVAYFIIAFCVYWLLRTFHFAVHLVAAYRQMQKNLKTDWIKELNALPGNWEDIYHLIIFPMYKEDLKVVRESFRALLRVRYPKERMIVVLATEERGGERTREVGEAILQEFGDKFFRLLVTCHPKDIVGEIAGKGSNETWAGKQAKKEVIDPSNIPYKNIVVSCFDADAQVYPQYFSCLAYYYLTSPHPTRASYQPIPLYLNNFWESPFFSRVVSSSNIFWQMMQQQREEKIVTYSSHSMSFQALAEMNFWQTNVVSEDAGIFWKSFLFYDGDYRIVPLHYPLSMDSCAADSFWKTVISQYRQQRRWAWGSEGIPYLLFGCYKNWQEYRLGKRAGKTLGFPRLANKRISFKKAFRYIFLLIEGFWAWATNALLILCLGWLPLILGGQDFKATVLAYNLPQITRDLMTVALFGLIICIIISTLLLTPRPKKYGKWKSASMIFQWLCFPLTIIVFGSIPAIESQTKLMLGKRLGFWVTPKARR